MEFELEGVHLTVLALTALMIVYADHEAFSYIRSKKLLLNPHTTLWLHRGVWVGLLLMIGSGILMFLPFKEYYLTDSAFLIKMCMVAALVVNAVLIGKLSSIASRLPFAELPSQTKISLMISGAVSSAGWIGAAIIGFFFL